MNEDNKQMQESLEKTNEEPLEFNFKKALPL